MFGRRRPRSVVVQLSPEDESLDPKRSREEAWRFLETFESFRKSSKRKRKLANLHHSGRYIAAA